MYKNHDTYSINRVLCSRLLLKLQIVENKCDRITSELSEVKALIVSLPPGIGTLLDSIERCANELHEQSIQHREYVERSINGESTLHLIRRIGDGL